jgi:hypothetical protein
MWPCTKINRFIGDYLFRLFKVSINYMQPTPPNNTKILASMPPPPKFDIGVKTCFHYKTHAQLKENSL